MKHNVDGMSHSGAPEAKTLFGKVQCKSLLGQWARHQMTLAYNWSLADVSSSLPSAILPPPFLALGDLSTSRPMTHVLGPWFLSHQ